MEGSEIRRLFYVLISDRRGQVRDDARERIIAAGGDDYAALARAGAILGEAIGGEAPAGTLADARKEFDSLPLGGQWNGYREAAGQTLIAASRTQQGRSAQEQEALLEEGLMLIGRAQDGGVPVSRYSIEQIKPVAEGEGRLAPVAGSIIKQNALLLPDIKPVQKRQNPVAKKAPGTGGMKGTA
ncbi:hypothetical protein L0Y65_05670 [Candidatus Micrarchaeota archaeon]|nr:hypothetical protein [Candidatus Micrarchaeota archaeon]